MSDATLRQLLPFLASSPHEKLRVNWHGGEPLLAGLGFFREIARRQGTYPAKTWMNGVQTNATLLDEEWSSFFSENHFGVGVSIDGSEATHDRHRVNVAGHGTYQAAMRGVESLRRHNIYPGLICTVTKRTAGQAKEMLASLVQAEFRHIAFNAFYNTSMVPHGDAEGLTEDEWFRFLVDIFESWLELNDPRVCVREIDSMLAWVRAKAADSCAYRGTCHRWFVVNYDGEVYPCERLGRDPKFGNVSSIGTISNLIESSAVQEWRCDLSRLPSKCNACPVQTLCRNGCSSHRRLDDQGVPLYVFCETRRGLYNYIQNRMKGKDCNV